MQPNRNYGKNNESCVFEYAPAVLVTPTAVITLPTKEDYATMRYLPTKDEAPSGKVGVYYTPSNTWVEEDGYMVRQYEEHPIVTPIVVHRYSKLKLITAAKSIGKWDALKAFISTAGYEDEWAACMYLSDDYAGFEGIIDAVVAAGVATEDEVRQILAVAEDETLRMA